VLCLVKSCVARSPRRVFGAATMAAFVVPALLLIASPAAHAQFGTNLIVNGDAESGSGSSDGSVVAVPGWGASGNFTAVLYNASGGFPLTTDPGPASRGENFFAGGPDIDASAGTQSIDVSAIATDINAGTVSFVLSGFLGGFQDQDDNAVLTANFVGTGGTLGSASIGPVTASDRSNATGLLFRTTLGAVPVGTTSINLILNLTRTDGAYDDGYADNLSLVLANSPISSAAAPEPGSIALLAAGVAPLLGVALRRRRSPVA